MDADLAKLKSRIRILSDEEVVKILTSDKNQYAKGALDFAMEEAERRGLDINVDPSANYENKGDLLKKDDLSGIAGWLFFVAIGMAITPIVLLIIIVETLTVISNPTTATILIDYPYARILIFVEIILNIALLCFYIYTAYYFFKKDSRLPKMFIVLVSSHAIFALIDYLMGINAYGIPDYSGFKDVFRIIVYAAIWVPYFKKSERVKATFVN